MPVLAELKSDMVLFTYSETTETSKEYYLHCHNFYEIYYFIEGDVDYLVEGRHYKPSPYSLLLLTPNVFHGVRINSEKAYRRLTLHFLPDILTLDRRHLLLSAFPTMEKYSGKEIYYPNPENYRIFSFFQSLIDCTLLPQQLKDSLFSVYMEALLSQITVMGYTGPANWQADNNTGTIGDIVAYLNAHLTDAITLDQISEKFFISKHHLNKVFKKATGTTVGNYLLYKRVIFAQQLLINGHSATDAAAQSGFRDYSAFYRAYGKITGHSPLSDRGSFPSLISTRQFP